jgi:hypothetical protein
MSRGTTLRNIRVDDTLWSAARAAATERGEDVSVVVRRALTAYVSRDTSDLPGSPEDLGEDSTGE